ncbi:MAG: hypothetical protein AAGA03_17315 [Planctomycetota bacterium]
MTKQPGVGGRIDHEAADDLAGFHSDLRAAVAANVRLPLQRRDGQGGHYLTFGKIDLLEQQLERRLATATELPWEEIANDPALPQPYRAAVAIYACTRQSNLVLSGWVLRDRLQSNHTRWWLGAWAYPILTFLIGLFGVALFNAWTLPAINHLTTDLNLTPRGPSPGQSLVPILTFALLAFPVLVVASLSAFSVMRKTWGKSSWSLRGGDRDEMSASAVELVQRLIDSTVPVDHAKQWVQALVYGGTESPTLQSLTGALLPSSSSQSAHQRALSGPLHDLASLRRSASRRVIPVLLMLFVAAPFVLAYALLLFSPLVRLLERLAGQP